MATTGVNRLMGRLQQLVLAPKGSSLTDGQLLDQFCSHHQDLAFEALVRRHGPMVLAVCKRVCRQQQDAEDAFQASFLVLARKAHSVRPAEAVGNWLYGVAYRTALRARATTARRVAREKQVKNVPHPTVEIAPTDNELENVLDQELSKLADKYRTPLVLCELEGRSRREVARQLKLPEGTLSSRLATARRLLAARLTRRGVTLTSGILGSTLPANHATAALSPQLLAQTAKAGCLLAAGQACTDSLISTQVTSLMEGTLKTMLISKLKLGVALLALTSLVCAGGYSLSAATAGATHAAPVKNERRSRIPPQTQASTQPKPKANTSDEIAKPARLRGRFTDADSGKPVAGAILRVYVPGLPRTKIYMEATSDLEGRYELSLPFGHASFAGVIGPAGYYTQDASTYGPLVTSPAEPQFVRDFSLQRGSRWQVEITGVKPNKSTEFNFMLLPVQDERLPYASSSIINARGSADGKAIITAPFTNVVRKLQGWIKVAPAKLEIADATLQFEGEFNSEQIKGTPEVLNEGNAIGLRDTHNRSAIVKGAEVAVLNGKAILRLKARPTANAGTIEVRGSVVDEADKPIQGAKIRPAMGSENGSAMTSFEAKTDANGEFLLREVVLPSESFEPEHWISLIVTKAGSSGVQTKRLSLPEIKDLRLAEFGKLVLKPGLTLKGKVVNENGQPVEGAAIINSTDYFLYSALECRTDAEGRFTMPDLSSGIQKISAQYGESYGVNDFKLDVDSGGCVITVKKLQPRPAAQQ